MLGRSLKNMIFSKPKYITSSLLALDNVISSGLAEANNIIDNDPFLNSLPEECDPGSLAYNLIVSAVDLIYTKSIIKFGPGSKQSKKIASALRVSFESRINNHLMNNLAGLQDFIRDDSIHLVHGLLPSDLHGAWVVMAFERSRGLDFSRKEVQTASKTVGHWLELHTKNCL